jgi:2-C-methyl-D-erythritol 4-phosphate cytidylyltransferase
MSATGLRDEAGPAPAGAAPRLVALVPAAGGGSRFGGEMPKQYADLAGRPVVARTLERLTTALPAATLVVALAPDDAHWAARVGALPGVLVLRCGGATRAATVANALAALAARCAADDWILVHDAARPCVPVDALRRLVAELAADPVGGLLAVPVADTLKRAADVAPPRVARTEPRAGLWQAQTPQMFRYGLLRSALAAPAAATATDEAQAVEAFLAPRGGAGPRLVAGSALNLKVTYPADLALAAAILGLSASL